MYYNLTNSHTSNSTVIIVVHNDNKQCSKCKEIKSVNDFYNNKGGKNGKMSYCIKCRNAQIKIYQQKNKNKVKIWINKHNKSEKRKNYLKQWYNKNRARVNLLAKLRRQKKPEIYKKISKKHYDKIKNTPEHKEKRKNYYIKNKEKISKQKKGYMKIYNSRADVKERQRMWRREMDRKRMRNDIEYRLKKKIKLRLYTSLKNNKYSRRITEIVGCSLTKLKQYLEDKFMKGMSWNNYGNKKENWVIDHIKPISSFNLRDEQQLKMCFHYTNLQPLWHRDNLTKSDFLPDGTRGRDVAK